MVGFFGEGKLVILAYFPSIQAVSRPCGSIVTTRLLPGRLPEDPYDWESGAGRFTKHQNTYE